MRNMRNHFCYSSRNEEYEESNISFPGEWGSRISQNPRGWGSSSSSSLGSLGKWSSGVLPLMLRWSLAWFPYFYSDCPWPYCAVFHVPISYLWKKVFQTFCLDNFNNQPRWKIEFFFRLTNSSNLCPLLIQYRSCLRLIIRFGRTIKWFSEVKNHTLVPPNELSDVNKTYININNEQKFELFVYYFPCQFFKSCN